MMHDKQYLTVAEQLSGFYGKTFGGKDKGRYRISAKLLRSLFGRKRLYESDISKLARAMLEQGFILVDMESYYVVMSANSFVNYRRVGDAAVLGTIKPDAG